MIGLIKKLLGIGPKVDFTELLAQGAQIIDVRSPGEFSQGAIPKSKNIPLDKLQAGMSKIDKNKPVITVCASGMRSGVAKGILKNAGYNVHNGGGWFSFANKVGL